MPPISTSKNPLFFDNLRYMFDFPNGLYVLEVFYVEFSGRQNDFQGKLDPVNGNWISGILIY